MAATEPEASTCGVSLVTVLTSVTSDCVIPFAASAWSSSSCSTTPTSMPIFWPLRDLMLREGRFGDDHVIAARIVGQHDHDAFRAAGTVDQSVHIGDQIGVELARGIRR